MKTPVQQVESSPYVKVQVHALHWKCAYTHTRKEESGKQAMAFKCPQQQDKDTLLHCRMKENKKPHIFTTNGFLLVINHSGERKKPLGSRLNTWRTQKGTKTTENTLNTHISVLCYTYSSSSCQHLNLLAKKYIHIYIY